MKALLIATLLFTACTTTTSEPPELAFQEIPEEFQSKNRAAQNLAIRIFEMPECRRYYVDLPGFPPGEVRHSPIWDYSTNIPAWATTSHNGDFHYTLVPLYSLKKRTVEELAKMYLHEVYHKVDWSNVDFSDRDSITSAERRAIVAAQRCLDAYTKQQSTDSIPQGEEDV